MSNEPERPNQPSRPSVSGESDRTLDSRDERDEHVAGWLGVEPLDEVTRARLIRGAMDASAPAPRARRPWLVGAAAAALVVVLIAIGVSVLESGDDENAQTTARTPTAAESNATATPDTKPAAASNPSANPAANDGSLQARGIAAAPQLPSLGALGDVSTKARLRSTLRGWSTTGPQVPVTPCAFQLGAAAGTPIAAGTGSIDGRPATVVVVEHDDGSRTARASVDDGCEPGPQVPLR